jgi:hypothetical protein
MNRFLSSGHSQVMKSCILKVGAQESAPFQAACVVLVLRIVSLLYEK